MARLYSAIQVSHMEKSYDNIRIMVLLLWLLSVSLMVAHAQKTLVCDGATHFPIRDVLVKVDGRNRWNDHLARTNQSTRYVPNSLFLARKGMSPRNCLEPRFCVIPSFFILQNITWMRL